MNGSCNSNEWAIPLVRRVRYSLGADAFRVTSVGNGNHRGEAARSEATEGRLSRWRSEHARRIQVGSEGVGIVGFTGVGAVSTGQQRSLVLDGAGAPVRIGPFPTSNWHFWHGEGRFQPGVAYPIRIAFCVCDPSGSWIDECDPVNFPVTINHLGSFSLLR